MATQDTNPNKNNVKRFDGGLTTDVNDYHIKDNQWSYLRNGTVALGTGNVSNEPANKSCITASYPILGFIYLYDDLWTVFSGDGVGSEIGIYKEFTCTYNILTNETGIPNDFGEVIRCLNFHPNNLITGVAKMNFDCSWSVYWSDGHRNPDRTLNVDKPAWKVTKSLDAKGCQVETLVQPKQLDCDQLKLNRNVKIPCIHVQNGSSGGNLLNGTYYATISYTVNGQRVTNYLGLSNAVGVFTHENLFGALEIIISGLDDSYDEYELVVISITGNQSTVARRIGLYSTNQAHVFLDIIGNDLPVIPLELLPVHNPLMESSTSISQLGETMVRVGPRSKFDFNYQPLANKITVHWVSVEYPADYYRNGGTNTNHLRDENAALFIRWVYEDSDHSPSFHIPGRAPLNNEQSTVAGIYGGEYLFEQYNTAYTLNTFIVPLGDGGFQIAEGVMGYFETEEKYPINKPLVWDTLCGKKIRHHKFPDRDQGPQLNIYSDTADSPIVGPVIRVLGIKVLDISAPVDNDGNLIPGIVGYEILRGSREGNKTIIAKGIVNNFFQYELEVPEDDGSQPLGSVVTGVQAKSTLKKGLYANFPYNDLEDDSFISKHKGITDPFTGQLTYGTGPNDIFYNRGYYTPGFPSDPNWKDRILTNGFPHNMVSFHSPDTTFRRPFLSAKELKLCGIVSGSTALRFYEPADHPKHKLPTNFAFFIAALGGIALAVLKMSGPRSTSSGLPSIGGTAGASVTGISLLTLAIPFIIAKMIKAKNMDDTSFQYGNVVGARDSNVESVDTADRNSQIMQQTSNGAVVTSQRTTGFGGGTGSALGSLFAGVGGLSIFSHQWSEGINTVMDIILAFSQWQQYGLQQISHCFYNHYGDIDNGFNPESQRILISSGRYLDPVFQDFDNEFRINNLYRSRTVALKVNANVPNPVDYDPKLLDNSKRALYEWPYTYATHEDPTFYYYSRRASSYYASLKVRLRNQYGQIGDVKQVPIGCVNEVFIDRDPANLDSGKNIFESPVIFGGDTYITRYTEKNTMFFFYDWLYKQFEGYEFDYYKSRMVNYPAYWMDTTKWDMGDFIRGLSSWTGGSLNSLANSGQNTQPNPNIGTSGWLPSTKMSLDRTPSAKNANSQNGLVSGITTPGKGGTLFKGSLFVVKAAYFYLFCSGIRDFYVESEINVGYRDWEDPIQRRHYDANTFTDTLAMFEARPDVIKADNFYKYDYSLSVARSFINMSSWGEMQPTYYDPIVAETCYVENPQRIIYSLPQPIEEVRDAWRVFLANNYRDFHTKVLTIRSMGDNGAVILFEQDSPLQIKGTETLETLSGTALTIGTGELLQRASQSYINSDKFYRYGSSQSLRSVVNTPIGLFYISQSQGNIFYITDGIVDLALEDTKFWTSKYLQYEILKDFPNYDLLDNPVAGVGCQAIYDNYLKRIYFTKKDFKLKKESILPGATTMYDETQKRFYMVLPSGGGTGFGGLDTPNLVEMLLHDPHFFEDASWTMSYHIGRKEWLGWHDWHPDLVMPSQAAFSTIKGGGIWTHNKRTDLFCNFYGIDYPFEIEFLYNTPLDVTTRSSVEYYMEVFKYAENGKDRYLFMNENFDEAIVHNNEQNSGLLKLNLTPFDDPFAALDYPKYNLSSVDILYSYVENKYRFDMLTDLTDDRGMFTNARRQMWITAANGYHRELNQANLNYQKDVLEQKLFRGYQGSLFLRKKVSGNMQFNMMFVVNKTLESDR